MIKQLNQKAEDLELQLAGSKWFLPISFIIAIVVLAVVYSVVFTVSTIEENFELSRVQYDYINETYQLTTLR